MITELGNGYERMSEAREFVCLSGTEGETGMGKFTRVCGLDPLSVGQGDKEAIVGGYFIDARAADGKKVPGASGIGYCFVLGWGTARK